MASDTQLISRLVRSDTNLTASFNVTVEKDIYIGFYIPQNSSFSNYECGVMVSTDGGTYEPYVGGTASPNPDYPQEITNVTEDVEVVVENKNLFDKNNMQKGFIPVSGDYPTSNPSYPNARYYLVPVKANDSVAISGSTNKFGRVRCIDNVSNQVIGTISTSENDYYTSNNNYSSGFVNAVITAKKDIILAFMVIHGTDTLDTFQVEYGSTATLYTQHHEQTFTFPLGNEKLMLGDYLADDGKHHVREKYTITGQENGWQYDSSLSSPTDRTVLRISNLINYKSNNYLSNRFISGSESSNRLILAFVGSSRTIYLSIENSIVGIETEDSSAIKLSKIKAWLAENPTIIEYELEEEQEVIVPYTSAQQEVYNQIKQALSYEGQTNISSNQNAIFNVEAYQSTKLILESIDSRLTLVEG